MIKEKKKQIILIVAAFAFMGIGWSNFLYQQNHSSVEVAAESSRDELNLGDVQLVNSEASNENDAEYLAGIVSNEEIENNNHAQGSINGVNSEKNKQENIGNFTTMENAEKNNEEYFVETKLQRDIMYSEMLETYQKMLENAEIGETQKAIATQEINHITNIKNGIMISENLIKSKGFENVVILVNNETVSVVVKSSLLNQEQISQIQNIVSRELNVEIKNINITKK